MALVADLKQERTDLKKKVTLAVKRLQGAIDRDRPAETVDKLAYDLEVAYSDFLTSHEDYVNLVTTNTDYEEHRTVNGLNLEQYLAEVNGIYNNVMHNHDKRNNRELDVSNVIRSESISMYLDSLIGRARSKLMVVTNSLDTELYVDNPIELGLLQSYCKDLKPIVSLLLENKAKLLSLRKEEDVHDLLNSADSVVEEIDEKVRAVAVAGLSIDESMLAYAEQNPSSRLSTIRDQGHSASLSDASGVSQESATTATVSTISTPSLLSQHQPTSYRTSSPLNQSQPTQSQMYASSIPSSHVAPPATLHGITSAASSMYPGMVPPSSIHGVPLSTSIQGTASSSYYSGIAAPASSYPGMVPSSYPGVVSSSAAMYGVPSSYPGLVPSSMHGVPSSYLGLVPSSMHGVPSSYPGLVPSSMHGVPSSYPGLVPSAMYGVPSSYPGMVPSSLSATMAAPASSPYPGGSMPGSSIPSSGWHGVPALSLPHPSHMPYGHHGGPYPHGHKNTGNNVKMKPMDIPSWNGHRDGWPEFKNIWQTVVVPQYTSTEALAWQFKKSVTGGEAKSIIGKIWVTSAGSYWLMWERVCKRYDDVSLSVECCLSKLHQIKQVKENDHRGLVELVDKTESVFFQLSELDQLPCLTMRDVDIISEALPPSVATDWNKAYHTLSVSEKLHPFSSFMVFLNSMREIVYRLAEKQGPAKSWKEEKKSSTHNTEAKGDKAGHKKIEFFNCAIHKKDSIKHKTQDCEAFKKSSLDEKLSALKSIRACFRCFGDHHRIKCKKENPCTVCGKTNHHYLMCKSAEAKEDKEPATDSNAGESSNAETHSNQAQSSLALYPINQVHVMGTRRKATVFMDQGSNSVYITHRAAKKLGAKKIKNVQLEVRTTGGNETNYDTCEYEVQIRTESGKVVSVRGYGMDKITGRLSKLDCSVLFKLFPDYDPDILQRHSTEVDILIGTNYFGLHPKQELARAGENLSIMKGDLGICIVGTHPDLKEESQLDTNMVQILHGAYVQSSSNHSRVTFGSSHHIFDVPSCKHRCQSCSHFTRKEEDRLGGFIEGEELGTQVNPRCGSCRCSKCPIVGHTYSFNEEAQLLLMRENLRYDEKLSCWVTKYPWAVDPSTLPDNYHVALATLRRTEKKLLRDEKAAETYQNQMLDMLAREVCRKLSPEEIRDWDGTVYHISHLLVKNAKSKSTPDRMVFDSSQENDDGTSANNSWYKGVDNYINNLPGILLRWREEQVALVGDIRKMFNSVHLELAEQHCHRWLWRHLQIDREPDVYVMTRVNMGDRPAGAISTEAVYMTAERFEEDSPRAAVLLKENSYVDDIIDSVPDKEFAVKLTTEAEAMLLKGGFKIKFWSYSGDSPASEDDDEVTKVLGVGWNQEKDILCFKPALNFSAKRRGVHIGDDLMACDIPHAIPLKLTRRMVLSQVMKIYDPLGLLSPFTLQAKVFLRETWSLKLSWDEAVPEDLRNKWLKFFTLLYEVENNEYPRCLRPVNSVGNPWLIILSDGSDIAYGFAAFARWKLSNGEYESNLIMAKCRIAPVNKVSTPKMELNGAVLSKRGRKVIETEMRYCYDKTIQIVDSKTVLGMIHKISTRFDIYYGVRLGEIQSAYNGEVSCWGWMPGKDNTADWVTRPKDPAQLGPTSEWWKGPAFLSKPFEEWGIEHSVILDSPLPGEKKVHRAEESHAVESKDVLMIEYSRFSKFRNLLWTIARVMQIANRKSFKGGHEDNIKPSHLREAEELILFDMQKGLQEEMVKCDRKGRSGGRFVSLHPVKKSNGLWVIGSRFSFNPMQMKMNDEPQILLPPEHYVTKLIMVDSHRSSGHRGRDSTLSHFRYKYWTPYATKLAWCVRAHCQLCKLRDHILMNQQMGVLPVCRLKPAPPFSSTMVDLFGPYSIRGEVQKRTTGKAYGIIFTDMVMRAVHIEAAFGYDTDSFLLAFSRFVSIRGYPSDLYSDPGSQLVGADRELQDAWQKINKSTITKTGTDGGMQWHFGPGDSPWYQGAVEALIKGVKRSIKISMGTSRLSAAEFLTVCAEVANIMNERPVGIVPGMDSPINLFTPNLLLIGRCTAKNPGGWQPDSSKLAKRYEIVQSITTDFWKHWRELYAPSLVWDKKWHNSTRNLEVGDVVLMSDSNSLKGEYKLAVVREVFPSADGVVRKVALAYKNFKVGEKIYEYEGSPDVLVTRSVQRLSLLVPVEDTIPADAKKCICNHCVSDELKNQTPSS